MKTIVGGVLLGVLSMAVVSGCTTEGGATLAQPVTRPSALLRGDVENAGSCTTVTSLLDVDIPRVQVSGAFRVNGAAPLGYDYQRGEIELRSPTLGIVNLGSIHYGTYSRWIIPGVYDVVYKHLQGDVVPANAETMVLEGVDLSSSQTFDVDISSVLVMGTVTVNGGPAPASFYENGEIRLRDRKTGASFKVGRSNDGTFMTMVIPGLYDVLWHNLAGGSLVPVNKAAVLEEEVTVAGATQLDVDVPMVLRTGQFKINGAAPPAGFYENGKVSLRDIRTGDVFPLGQTRDQTYSKRIVPGIYDILYARILGGSMVPSNKLAVLATSVELSSDGSQDIDIPMVTLSGAFSLDGGHFPASIYNRARISLRGHQEGDVFALGTTGGETYQVKVIPGTYDVVYEALISTGLVPQNPWALVSENHSIFKTKSGTATLDVDVLSGWLGADVSIWGQAPPQGAYENGAILARDGAGEPVPIGSTNDGGGSARVLAASYDVHYAHLIGSQVPANSNARVGAGTAGPWLAPVQLDLHPGTLLGGFSQVGHPFPADPLERGVVALRDLETGDRVELGATSDGAYQRVLLAGTYEIVYDQVAGATVVANRGAVLGCVTFTPVAPVPGGILPGTGGLAGR